MNSDNCTKCNPDNRHSWFCSCRHQWKYKSTEDEIAKLRTEVAVLRQYGNKDCLAMADDALAEADLIHTVETLQFGCHYSIQDICNHVHMTESELRAIPEINDLLNK